MNYNGNFSLGSGRLR